MTRRIPARGGAFLCGFGWSSATCLVVLMLACQVSGQDERLTAEQVQAGFIYNFTKYTEWPLDFAQDADPNRFHICVIGNGPVVQQLDLHIQGKMASSRVILVRHLTEEPNVNGCEVLYVGKVQGKTEERLLAVVTGKPVLTVGSAPGFLRGQGMVTFVLEENRVRFEINARLAESVNIHFDSRILALARKRNEASR